MSKRVVITKSHKTVAKKSRVTKPSFALGVPCNVKVVGERTMRKNVVLDLHPSDPEMVVVRTGRRGRPAHLALSSIEKVRAL